MKANWNYPTSVRVGAERLAELGACCLSLNIKKPLLVTDPGIVSLPLIGTLLESCKASGLSCAIFSEVRPNPTGTNVEEIGRAHV